MAEQTQLQTQMDENMPDETQNRQEIEQNDAPTQNNVDENNNGNENENENQQGEESNIAETNVGENNEESSTSTKDRGEKKKKKKDKKDKHSHKDKKEKKHKKHKKSSSSKDTTTTQNDGDELQLSEDSGEEKKKKKQSQSTQQIDDLLSEDEGEEETNEKGSESDDDLGLEDNKKRKRALDDEDIELIEESLGVKVARRQDSGGFKRIKKRRTDSQTQPSERNRSSETQRDSEQQQQGDEEDPLRESLNESSEKPNKSKDKMKEIERELFEGDEGNEEPEQPQPEKELNFDELSDEDNFIVDAAGKPLRGLFTGEGRNQQLREAEDIFGTGFDDMMGEDEQQRQEGQQAKPSKLEDVFEPVELKEKYWTQQDELIKVADVPERLQSRCKGRIIPTDPMELESELHNEAQWIFHHAFETSNLLQDAVLPEIEKVLRFFLVELLEIPYITKYRSDYVRQLTNFDLWEIYDWDEKWFHLKRRKEQLKLLVDQIENEDEKTWYLDSIDGAATERELDDLMDHFVLYHENMLGQKSDNQNFKTVKAKRSFKNATRIEGFTDFLQDFGITPRQFGENLAEDVKLHVSRDASADPLTLALRFKGEEMPDDNIVIELARNAIAEQIATEPAVRQALRSVFNEQAVVSTQPTPKGKQEVDAFHPSRIVLSIANKPFKSFLTTRFLEILKAEKQGLITKTIALPEERQRDLVDRLKGYYTGSEIHTPISSAWNSEREEIIRLALAEHLFPLFEKESIQTLTEEAQSRFLIDYSEIVRKILSVGPYRPPTSEHSHWKKNGVKVMAVNFGFDKEPTFCAIITRDGELTAHIRIDKITGSNKSEEYGQDFQRLSDFIKSYKPDVIAVNAEPDAKRMYGRLKEATVKAERESTTHITFVNTDVAKAYAKSYRARAEFPDLPYGLYEAISLARRLQDPLVEIAGTVNEHNEFLALQLHALQDAVPEDVKMKAVLRQFLAAVNNVGVDVNKAVDHKHAAHVLQFVAGLGPRKASHLISHIFKIARLPDRPAAEAILGAHVFTNAAGFLRILERYFPNEEWYPLDDTRIHPDDYVLVKKIAKDAAENDGNNEDEQDGTDLVKLMKEPQRLNDIDFRAFAETLEAQGNVKKYAILNDIKRELTDPFGDERELYRDPDEKTLFRWFFGPTDPVQAGQLVNCTVQHIDDKVIWCRLPDTGIRGVINIGDISDKGVNRISDEIDLKPGSLVPCRILEVDKTRMSVRLSCKSSVLKADEFDQTHLDTLAELEPYLNLDKQEVRKAKPKQKREVKRLIQHPLFQQLDKEKSEQFLSTKSDGEVMFRPSSKGVNFLVISWRFRGDTILHITIEEDQKIPNNPLALGRRLTIGNQSFDDLDEILARYLEPMVTFANDMFQNKVFRDETAQEIEKSLQKQKQAQPNRIPYHITISEDHPGKFALHYLPNMKAKKEIINLTPDGYRFRGKTFKDADQLINWFKKHWKEIASSSTSSTNLSSSAKRTLGEGPQAQMELSRTPGREEHVQQQPQAMDWQSAAPQMHQPPPHQPPAPMWGAQQPQFAPPPPQFGYAQPPMFYPPPQQATFGMTNEPAYMQQPPPQAFHDSRGAPPRGNKTCFNCGKEGHLSRDCPEPRRDRGGRDYNNRDSNRDSRGSRDSRDSRDSGSRDNRNSGSSSSSSNRTYNNSNNNNNNNNRQTTWETSTFKSGWDSPQQEQ